MPFLIGSNRHDQCTYIKRMQIENAQKINDRLDHLEERVRQLETREN